MKNTEPSPIRVGVSTCLLGEEVRYNGGHKRNNFVVDILSGYFEWVPVCPEVEIGLGIPREPIRLVGDVADPRLVGTTNTELDVTDRMNAFSEAKVQALQQANIHGYILKKDSPSCGMERVKVYTDKGMPEKKGVGLFARVLLESMPLLPVEEEGRLNDLPIRENFITRVFCYYRWQNLLQSGFTVAKLVDFHARHKYLIMSHDEVKMRELGRIVAEAKSLGADAAAVYAEGLFAALKKSATRRKHTNVLQHIMGFFKRELSADDKQALLDTIQDYHQGFVPLVVPITLIKHYLRKFEVPYIADQVYLTPHPKELMLQNHV